MATASAVRPPHARRAARHVPRVLPAMPGAICCEASSKIPTGDLFTRRQPNVRLAFDIVDEVTQRGDPVRLSDDVRMQADIHDPAGAGAFGIKLVEAELEHVDTVAGGKAAAREHVEVVDVVRIGHADDRTMNGVDQVRLVVVEIVAVGDNARLLEQRRRMRRAADCRRQPGLGRPADHLLIFVERAADHRALLIGLVRVRGEQIVLRPVVRHQLPAALLHGVDDAAALHQDHAVAGAGGRDAHRVEHIHQTPDADALAVLAPGPVRGVEHVAGQRVRDRRRPAGKQRLLLAGPERLPVFDIDGEDQRDMGAAGKFQRRAIRQRHERHRTRAACRHRG